MMCEKIKRKFNVLFIIGLGVLSFVLMIIYMSNTGNANQVFKDVISEYTAIQGSNKSAEYRMIFMTSIIGAITYILVYFRLKLWNNYADENKRIQNSKLLIYLLIVFSLVRFIIWEKISYFALALLALAIILYCFDKDIVISGTVLAVLIIYAESAVFRVYVYIGGTADINPNIIYLIAIVFPIVIAMFSRGLTKTLFLKIALICQIIIPFVLLVFLETTYKSEPIGTVEIDVPKRVIIFIWGIIIFLLFSGVCRIKSYWSNINEINDSFGWQTCAIILVFNTFGGSGAILPVDLHHPYENIIAYSQIFELGQKPFSQYIPISGLYSVVQGWFLYFFGLDRISNYYLTANIFYLMVAILTVIALKELVSSEWLLFLVCLFSLIPYNRVAFIALIMFTLMNEKLIRKKNSWLKVWFLTSLFHGLYYPVFGAAVCLAFVPMGIYIIKSYIKSGELAANIKQLNFWIEWIICLIPAMFCFPLLRGTLKHTLAMGNQTLFADGMTRFGQAVPEEFMPYLTNMVVKQVIYYFISYIPIISIVWVSVVLFLIIGKVHFSDNHKVRMDNPVGGLSSLSIGIMALISYTYTTVRLDAFDIYSRNYGIIQIVFLLLIVIAVNNKYIDIKFIVGYAVILISIQFQQGSYYQMPQAPKYESAYVVPAEYKYVRDDNIKHLGECFVASNIYEQLLIDYQKSMELDKKDTYIGSFQSFGRYFLFDIKADSTVETVSIKGESAAKETIDIIRNNNTYIGNNISPLENYYLYNWLMTSGEYVYNPKDNLFEPNKKGIDSEEIKRKNSEAILANSNYENYNLSKIAGSWGSSMETLKPIFENVPLEYDLKEEDIGVRITFDKEIDGDEADFLYLEVGNLSNQVSHVALNQGAEEPIDISGYEYGKALFKEKNNPDDSISIVWSDEQGHLYTMNCEMDEGKLLIPLGAGKGWLLNNHGDIRITQFKMLYDYKQTIEIPQIVNLKFLKLREIE